MATLSLPPTPTSPPSVPIPRPKPNPSLNPFSSSSSTPSPQEDSRPPHPSSPPTIEVEPERPLLDSRSGLASSGKCHSSDTLDCPQTRPVSHPSTPSSSWSSPSKVMPDTPALLLFHVSFNQDQGFFAAGTDRGFRIFNCDPFRQLFCRDFDGSGIGIVEMLFQCNILAIVGGGACPYYPSNRVMIWDDHQGRCTGELSFRSEVRAVRLHRDVIIVVLEQKILVYRFTELKLLHQIETVPNPKGLCAVSQLKGSLVLVCPGGQKGQIRVEHYGIRRTKFIMAHDSKIACLAVSQDGRLVATASSKGTLVRVFSSIDGTFLQEVRRGADRADIYSLAFSVNMKWLAVSSDKGTVHVFSLKVNLGGTINSIPRCESDSKVPTSSKLSFIKGVLPKYFNSEWSVAQFRLRQNVQYIVAFGSQRNTVVILGMDGSFFRCQFDPEEGGAMKQLENYNFLKPHAC